MVRFTCLLTIKLELALEVLQRNEIKNFSVRRALFIGFWEKEDKARCTPLLFQLITSGV
jgi:hypothetical protein